MLVRKNLRSKTRPIQNGPFVHRWIAPKQMANNTSDRGIGVGGEQSTNEAELGKRNPCAVGNVRRKTMRHCDGDQDTTLSKCCLKKNTLKLNRKNCFLVVQVYADSV